MHDGYMSGFPSSFISLRGVFYSLLLSRISETLSGSVGKDANDTEEKKGGGG